MISKYVAWALGGLLVLVLGTVAFFWKSQDKAALAPVASNTTATDSSKQEVATQTTDESLVMKTAPTTDASLDDIAKSIEADSSYDQATINNEATAEQSSLQEGNATINDLGQTYDESKY